MALAEYRLDGRTYLFETTQVPKGAVLVTDDVEVPAVVLFHDQADVPEKPKRGRRAANKQATPPANKSAKD